MKFKEVSIYAFEIYHISIFFCRIFKHLNLHFGLVFLTGIFLSQHNIYSEVILNGVIEL